MTKNVVGSIHLLPQEYTFGGMNERAVAFVEWKVPSFAFADREVQKAYVREAADLLHELSGKTLPKDQIWVNVTHAVDGIWGIDGHAFTNAELMESISRSQ
jgi:hypothetical protein